MSTRMAHQAFLGSKLRVMALGIATVILSAGGAGATVIITNNGVNFSDTTTGNLDHVLFNGPTDVTLGTTVTGHLQNSDPNVAVLYMGAGGSAGATLLVQNATSGGGGQADITLNPGTCSACLLGLTWSLSAPNVWNEESFKIEDPDGVTGDTVTFLYSLAGGGSATATFNLSNNNFFSVVGDPGVNFISAKFTINGVAIHDFQQDRIGPNLVPVPETLSLFAGGLGCLAFLTWRKNRQARALTA